MKEKIFTELSDEIELENPKAYLFTKHDADILFEVLNEKVFMSKLPYTPFVFKKSSLRTIDTNASIAEFRVAISNESRKKYFETFDPKHLKFVYYIWYQDFRIPFKFESMIMIILHEMIHEYVFFKNYELYGNDYIRNLIIADKSSSTVDPHGKDFQEIANMVKQKTDIDIAKEFDLEQALSTKIDETKNNSSTFIVNGSVDAKTMKLAKLIRKVYKDDGSTIIEIEKDGTLLIRFR